MKSKVHPASGPASAEAMAFGLHRDVSRKILHVDMDSFYASVEQRDNPELRGKPVAVGRASGRGVVATASYEARRFGVGSAMPSMRAKQLCPSLIFVEPRMAHYKAVSAEIRAIFARYTDLIEPVSLDEAFLDVTCNKVGATLGVEVARLIKADIRRELNLVASAGVSYCKFLAKVASDWRKPDGLCTIHPDRAQAFIDQLPVQAIWGVGPVTAGRLKAMGVVTGADLRAVPAAELISRFGGFGGDLYRYVRGIDDRPVRAKRIRKSVSCEQTARDDVREGPELDAMLEAVVNELSRRLSKANFIGSTLTLKVRFYSFETVTRSETADIPFDADPQRDRKSVV